MFVTDAKYEKQNYKNMKYYIIIEEKRNKKYIFENTFE